MLHGCEELLLVPAESCNSGTQLIALINHQICSPDTMRTGGLTSTPECADVCVDIVDHENAGDEAAAPSPSFVTLLLSCTHDPAAQLLPSLPRKLKRHTSSWTRHSFMPICSVDLTSCNWYFYRSRSAYSKSTL